MSSTISTHSANIADLLLDVVFLVDAQGILVDVSAGCEQLLGYRPEELAGRRMLDFVVEEDRARTLEEAARVASGSERIGFENRYRRKDGSMVDIMWSARRIDSDGLRIGVARDISVRKQAERRQSALYAISEAAHQAPDLPSLCQRIHEILDGLVGVAGMAVITDEPAGHRRTAYRAGAAASGDLYRAGEDWRGLLLAQEWLSIELRGQAGPVGGLLLRAKHGPYPAPDRELLEFTAAQIGMALERKRLHEELLRHACHDELTGLPNRYLFFDRINTALARVQRTGVRMGVLYVDVDGFKQVNDQYGHDAGDALLREVALRLVGCARHSDTVARLGGDEFVLILEDLVAADDADRVAGEIGAALRRPMRAGGAELCVGASVGIALFPDHGQRIEELLKHADVAMYRQKRKRTQTAADGSAPARALPTA